MPHLGTQTKPRQDLYHSLLWLASKRERERESGTENEHLLWIRMDETRRNRRQRKSGLTDHFKKAFTPKQRLSLRYAVVSHSAFARLTRRPPSLPHITVVFGFPSITTLRVAVTRAMCARVCIVMLSRCSRSSGFSRKWGEIHDVRWTYSVGRNVIYGIYDGSVYLLLQVEHTLMFWGFFFSFISFVDKQTHSWDLRLCAYAVCSWMLTIGAISSCHSLCTIVPTLCVGVHCAARHTHTHTHSASVVITLCSVGHASSPLPCSVSSVFFLGNFFYSLTILHIFHSHIPSD